VIPDLPDPLFSSLLDIRSNADGFTRGLDDMADRIRNRKNLGLAVPPGEKIKRKMTVFLDLMTEFPVRLTAKPPISKYVFG